MKRIDNLLMQAIPKEPMNYEFTLITVSNDARGGFKAIQEKTELIKALKRLRGETRQGEIIEAYFDTAAELEEYLNTISRPCAVRIEGDIYLNGAWIETETNPKPNGDSH